MLHDKNLAAKVLNFLKSDDAAIPSPEVNVDWALCNK